MQIKISTLQKRLQTGRDAALEEAGQYLETLRKK